MLNLRKLLFYLIFLFLLKCGQAHVRNVHKTKLITQQICALILNVIGFKYVLSVGMNIEDFVPIDQEIIDPFDRIDY